MPVTSRLSALICIFLVLTLLGANFFPSEGRNLQSPKDERAIMRNVHGAVIQDKNGQRINYSREQLEAQETAAYAGATSPEPIAYEVASSSTPEAFWSYAAFGSGIGLSNIIVAQNGASPEIYSGAGFNSYWIAQRYNSTTNDYDEVYVSPYFSPGISRIKVADVVGGPGDEIIVAVQDGHIYFYDQASKALISTIATAANGLNGLDVADVDGDGANDLVLCTGNHLYVYSGSGALKWELSAVGGLALVVAQMDSDSALEIAVTDGHVIDCATHSAQWTWSYGFGAKLAAADIDGDGMKELIVAEGWQFVWAYDIDRQLPKWSISTSLDIGALLVTDIDGDGNPEVLVGEGQWGRVIAFDPVTQQQKWFVQNPEHGVTNIAVGDVDSDGKVELLWGAGASSSGPDHLFVANWQTGQIKWQNIHLDGPFIGPEIGDLDGDGRDEMVVISWSSDSGYGSGRILVFDAVTRRLRAISSAIVGNFAWTGVHDLKLRDVDRDGRLDILVAADRLYDGVIEVYSFDSSNNFSMKWTNATRPFGAPFYSVDAADIDGDGEMEIVGGVGQAHSGAQGIFVYVYSYSTGNEKWHSLHMGWSAITGLGLADVNGDGTKEIVAMGSGRDVYIFDGPSKLLEGILTGPFTAMRVQNVGGVLSIVLGNSTGDLIMYGYSGGSYGQTYKQRLVSASIGGFTIDPQDRVWIGTPGAQFGSSGTLTEVTLTGTVLAEYSGYGSSFGLRTAFVPASLLFFTTGSYSVVAFPTCTAAISSTRQAVPAAGGTSSVDLTAGSSCSWAALSNSTWINITSGGAGNGNGTVAFSVAPNSGPARIGTVTIAGLTLFVSQAAGGPVNYQGYLDAAGCGIITGWLWDGNLPNAIISVEIFDGTNFITSIPANLFREDIVNAGIGNGFHGFSFSVPQSLRDGQPHNIRALFPGTNIELGNSPRQIGCTVTALHYQGYHDGAGCGTIAGWAWNVNDPDNPINVDILDGGTLIATVPAVQFRPDLVPAGIGNAFHGFSFTVPSSMKDGLAHSIRVRFPGTSTSLGNTPRTIICSGAPPVFQGYHDAATCSVISGWAWDGNDPNSPINVAIFADGQLIATVLAIQFRQDLANAGIGNGYHAFSFNTPASLKDGQQHLILVRFSGSATGLSNSPKPITCASQ